MFIRRVAITARRTTVATVLVGCVAGCNANDESPTAANARGILRDLRADSATIEADGVTSTMLRATLAGGDFVERRLVTFSTSNGTLVAPAPSPVSGSPSTVNVDATGAAAILLRSSLVPGTVLISASADTQVATALVVFAPALADSIRVETPTVKVEADFASSILVTAQLRRNVGQVTPGAVVRFSAATATGDSIGRFGIPTQSDASGVSTVRFFPADSLYLGRIVISASTTGRRGVVIGTTSVNTVRGEMR